MTSSSDLAASTPVYLRPAKPSEIPALATVYTRAFSRDPFMNWLGGVRTLVPHHTAQDARTRRTLAALRSFQLVFIKMAQILGLIIVVVEREGTKEKIAGGALWLPPGVSMDPSLLMLLRISPWRILWRWGLGGLKRSLVVYTPKAEKTTDEVFATRKLKRLDSWHLFGIAIDPDCEGKGYCSLLIRDGFKRASGKPVHLEASTPRSRDIYAHVGFELNKELRFGVGSVDEMGVRTKGAAAVGFPVFIMTKWETL